MAYASTYESATNNIIRAVEAHCRHLTNGGVFDPSSVPPLARVEQWIDQTYYDLQAHLAAAGYATTVTNAAALSVLERLNVFGTVMQVELSHPITGRGGEENDRYKTYRDMYLEGLALLETDALAALGHTRSTELGSFLSVGGVSKSRKDVAYDDTDAVQPRFERDFGKHPAVRSISVRDLADL